MRVYVHGNCQASAIGWMLQEAQPDWKVTSREVHTFDTANAEVVDAYREQVRSADLLLVQPVSRNYRDAAFLSLDWIRENKDRHSVLKIFPSIYFRGYNPQSFDLHMHGHIMNYHDVHVADMFLAGVSPDSCYEQISSPGFFTQDFARAEFFRSLRELSQRERAARVDAKASTIILNEHQDELLFHTFNHPGRSVLKGVIDQLMRKAGQAVTLDAEGPSYLSNIRIMPYRSLALHLDMSKESLQEEGLMIRPGIVESLRDYVEAAYSCYRTAGPEVVSERLSAHPEASSYLQRFHRAGQGTSLDAEQLVPGLFRDLLGRKPSGWEVEYWLKRLLEIGPAEVVRCFVGSAEYQERLARRAEG